MKSLKKLIPTIIRTYKNILGIKIPESPEEHERRVDEIIQRHELEAKIKAHYERARNMMTTKGILKISAYKEAENSAIEILGAENAKSIILENDKAHIILFHLAKNPSKAKELELVFRVDALKGLKEASEIYKKLMPWRNLSRAANPETTIRGGIPGGLSNKAKAKTEDKLLNPDEKIGKPEKRVQALLKIISNMLENGVFSTNDTSWPRSEIWEQAVREEPRLFPDKKDDERDGVFAKAYNRAKKEFA